MFHYTQITITPNQSHQHPKTIYIEKERNIDIRERRVRLPTLGGPTMMTPGLF
ncbi:hypothetical protein Leryth_006386, partial [Lithospermum erythrorhizon]